MLMFIENVKKKMETNEKQEEVIIQEMQGRNDINKGRSILVFKRSISSNTNTSGIIRI